MLPSFLSSTPKGQCPDMQLCAKADISANSRLSTIRMLAEYVNFSDARHIEACVYAMSVTHNMYTDKMQQIIFNERANASLYKKGIEVVNMTDEEMAEGTLIEDIALERHTQRLKFEQIMQEKYDRINNQSFKTTLKCRRCGSAEVAWEQKQTRGADEAMTVFCTCSKCKNRWTMT